MAGKKQDTDSRVTKRKVTLVNYGTVVGADGKPSITEQRVEDYVRPDFLDAYVAAAQANGWQSVTVSEEPDAGPAGYHGATHIPAGLDHPLAGQTFDATEEK